MGGSSIGIGGREAGSVGAYEIILAQVSADREIVVPLRACGEIQWEQPVCIIPMKVTHAADTSENPSFPSLRVL